MLAVGTLSVKVKEYQQEVDGLMNEKRAMKSRLSELDFANKELIVSLSLLRVYLRIKS